MSHKELAERAPLIPLADWQGNDVVINPVKSQDLEARKVIRARIYELQATLAEANSSGGFEEEMGVVTHHFPVEGLYARELFIPAGTVMVSHLHKFPRVCVISKGDITFTTEYGTQRVVAPYVAAFPPGSKVALFTHADTIWTAILATPETDIDKIEAAVLAKNHEEYDAFCLENNLGIGEESCLLD